MSAVVTDNASNMKSAFRLSLEEQEPQHEDDEDDLWQDISDTASLNISAERISCFAHSLQLTIKDGLKDRKSYSSAIAKTSKLTSLLHTKASFKVK